MTLQLANALISPTHYMTAYLRQCGWKLPKDRYALHLCYAHGPCVKPCTASHRWLRCLSMQQSAAPHCSWLTWRSFPMHRTTAYLRQHSWKHSKDGWVYACVQLLLQRVVHREL